MSVCLTLYHSRPFLVFFYFLSLICVFLSASIYLLSTFLFLSISLSFSFTIFVTFCLSISMYACVCVTSALCFCQILVVYLWVLLFISVFVPVSSCLPLCLGSLSLFTPVRQPILFLSFFSNSHQHKKLPSKSGSTPMTPNSQPIKIPSTNLKFRFPT